MDAGHVTAKSYKVVNAIFKTIIDALLRGEVVNVVGLGRFEVREYQPTSKPVSIYHKQKIYGRYRKQLPVRKRVWFTPSESLRFPYGRNDRFDPTRS